MTMDEIASLPAADAEQQHVLDEVTHKADYDAIHSKAFAERCEHEQPITITICTMPAEAGQ